MGVVGTSSALEILQESREILLQWGDHGKAGICHGVLLSSMMCAKQGSLWDQHPPLKLVSALFGGPTKIMMCPRHQTPHCSPLLQNRCSISPSVSASVHRTLTHRRTGLLAISFTCPL